MFEISHGHLVTKQKDLQILLVLFDFFPPTEGWLLCTMGFNVLLLGRNEKKLALVGLINVLNGDKKIFQVS